jgi:hypothetical protein
MSNTISWQYQWAEPLDRISSRSYAYPASKSDEEFHPKLVTRLTLTKRLIVIQAEMRQTFMLLFASLNFVVFGVTLTFVTNYGMLVILLATAVLFRQLAHLTTLIILARLESNGR